METKKDYIENALNKDVDLREEEYRAKCEKADSITESHGIEGRAPLSEARRHKRIQTNFYGTALNVMLSVLAEVSQTNALLTELIGIQHASMPPNAKAQYDALSKKIAEGQKNVGK